MKAISVQNISKNYAKVAALKGLSFEVEKGEIFGVIGPDGAGKTTLFRILTTLLLANSGKASLEGLDVVKDYKKIRQMVGYMPGRFSLYQDLTVEENLKIFATVFNTTIQENYHLIKDIYQQIEPFKKRRAGALSGGMKQKLALSCALIHKPNILFLDEPTTGVDPVSRKEFWDMLAKLKEEGITIVVSTPYMDEASLCDRIALMQGGEFLRIDTPENIMNSYKNILLSVKADQMSQLLKDLKAYQGLESCFAFGDSHHISVDKSSYLEEGDDWKIKLLKYLEYKRHRHILIEEISATVEDCFMELSEGS